MRIGICDDLISDRIHLGELVSAYYESRGIHVDIDEFESGEELMDVFEKGKYQIIFMDVYMGAMSGVQAARAIRETDPACSLVITTTSPDHAIDSYEVHASDYLLKPFGAREVEEALSWCSESMEEQLRGIELSFGEEKRTVLLTDIAYISSEGKGAEVHTASGEKLNTDMSLTDLEGDIDDVDFLRCHKGFLVNLNHIKRPDNASFIMDTGESVPISGDNHERIKHAFFDWAFKRAWESR
ncbi:MAG: response regulator transcription factor [Oscillospiraceae bacterium]|nr:response regulator transcription factor [Oscillospiraceae bacterium]